MREGIKRLLAVVRAHTRGASSTKRQVTLSDVHQRIVDKDSTRPGGVHNLVGKLLVAREDVQRQGLVLGVDILDRIVHIGNLDHGQQGAKQLILHQLVIPVNVGNDRGRDVQILLVRFASNHNIARLVLVEDLAKAVKVAVVDDTAIVDRFLGVLAVQLVESLLQLRDELVLSLGSDQHVVRSNAGLF